VCWEDLRRNRENGWSLFGLMVRHPKLRLYVENAGYPFRDEMIAMMTQYPQLHADVSTITWVIPLQRSPIIWRPWSGPGWKSG
jgi:predicted TIM-barrel fold metal-dependent hydrolase